jgi:hypothetical protein
MIIRDAYSVPHRVGQLPETLGGSGVAAGARVVVRTQRDSRENYRQPKQHRQIKSWLSSGRDYLQTSEPPEACPPSRLSRGMPLAAANA